MKVVVDEGLARRVMRDRPVAPRDAAHVDILRAAATPSLQARRKGFEASMDESIDAHTFLNIKVTVLPVRGRGEKTP